MPMQPNDVLAIDLGGTQMRAALVGSDGSVSRREARATPVDDDNIDSLLDLADQVVTKGQVRAVVAVPGRVDYDRGRLEHAPNLPDRWISLLRDDYLSDRLGLEVSLANDADVAAVGEAYFGAGRNDVDVAYMTVSTGVGAGVVLGGRLVRGRRSSIEIGHTIIDRQAFFSDAPATLEDLGSGSALERAAAASDLPASGRAIIELVEQGNARAAGIWGELVASLMLGVTNLAHLFMPQVVVLGGGVGLNGDLLLGPICRHLALHGPAGLSQPIRIVTARFGDNAGLAGAGAWHRATAAVAGGSVGRMAADPAESGSNRRKSA